MTALTEETPARALNTAPGHEETNRRQGSIYGTERKPRFDPETLASLRHRLPDYLQACGVELRRQGNRLVGRCPQHDDRTPSFAVFPNGQNCGCFPCNFQGDIFAVSQWMGRAGSFVEAVQDAAAVLGYLLPRSTASTATRPAAPPQRPAKQPEPPHILSDADKEKIRLARLRFSDAFWAGDEIIDRIAASLGLPREALRHAAWGESGLGLACPIGSKAHWLCYIYPNALKWRNPHPQTTPRFLWIVPKATAPWRMEWALKPEVSTIYLTEGESDCLALIAAGIESDRTAACVASPGTSFSREWVPLFTGKRVVLCFDLDPPGQAAAARIAAMLTGTAAEILTWKGTARHE
jgi:hypothetical protein